MNKKYRVSSRIAKFGALNMRQWCWIFIAIYKLLYVSIMMRLLGFKWIKKRIMANLSLINDDNHKKIIIAQQLHESIRLAARCLPFKLECLPKAIVLAEMLQARSISAEVKLGVHPKGQELQGHAWVSISGSNIAESKKINNKFTELKF